ncbi:MAG: AraC family transcriptional regulator [Oceanobacter sp.]
MLEHALLLDERGQKIPYSGTTQSDDWDVVQDFCKTVYMPYRVRPLVASSRPDSTMISAKAGRITLTRFSYGAGIHLDEFDPSAGKILVLNTLTGVLKHKADQYPTGEAETAAGDSFVVDCSRTDYWLKGDDQHMQLNLTLDHDLMEEVAERWFGFVPDQNLWTYKAKFAGPNSRWLSLLDYSVRTLNSGSLLSNSEAMGRQLEEMICVELLGHWAQAAGIDLEKGATSASPYYVRNAEVIFEAEARNLPTVASVAEAVGVSARTLSEGFRRFRGITPRDFLAARRLEGLRQDLLNAPTHLSVAHIASEWGYVNFGNMACKYKQHFGELPSQTRLSARHQAR